MESPTLRPAAEAFFSSLAALLLYFVRFGYAYGHSDQDEFLPLLLHRLDAQVLAADWFVQSQMAGFHVRTYFVFLLEALATIMPVWAAVLVFYVFAWVLLAGAVYTLARIITRDRLAALLALLLATVLTPQWTLGGNDLIHGMLVPSMFGWGLGLWGVYTFLKDRYAWAGTLIGLATWVQALVGLQLAGLLGLYLLIDWIRSQRASRGRRLFTFAALFLLSASVALQPLLMQQFAAAAAAPADAPSLWYILAAFRAPHHYLADAFSAHAVVRFALLAVLGLAAFAWPSYRRMLDHTGPVGMLLLLIAVVCAVAWVLTLGTSSLLITKLQLFKLTVLAKLFLVILIAGAVTYLTPNRLLLKIEPVLVEQWLLILTLLAWVVVGVGIWMGHPQLQQRIPPLLHTRTDAGRIETYARYETPQDAVYAVPPSWSGFRTHAQRAIVVNFKAYPFDDATMYEWFERMMAMAPLEPLPERGGAAILPALDAAYEALTPDAWARLAPRYGVSYLVRATPLPDPHDGFTELHQVGTWRIYRTPFAPE